MKFLTPIFANLVLLVSALGYGSLLRSLLPQTFSKIDRLAVVLLEGSGRSELCSF